MISQIYFILKIFIVSKANKDIPAATVSFPPTFLTPQAPFIGDNKQHPVPT